MENYQITIAVLFVAAISTIVGTLGVTVKEESKDVPEQARRPAWQRMTKIGIIIIILAIAGLGLGTWSTLQGEADARNSVNGLLSKQITGYFGQIKNDTGYDENTWSALIAYRIGLRSLLVQLDKSRGRSFAPTDAPSIHDLISDLKAKGVIDGDFASSLSELASNTYSAEWAGLGQEPDPRMILQVKRDAPGLLQTLVQKVNGGNH
jgi:hypothetical protein